MDNQKLFLKFQVKPYGEIEMRNDSDIHYREIKFWLSKNLTLNLLKSKSKKSYNLNNKIILYDQAINKLSKYKEMQ